LAEAVERAFKTLRFLSDKKKIKTKLSIDPEFVKYFEQIYGDENRFE